MSKQKLGENWDLIVNNYFALHNHVVLTDLEEGSVEGYLDVKDDATNAYGMIHGGALYALADVIAEMTVRSSGHAHVTQTAGLYYLASIAEERIHGHSYVPYRGSKTAAITAEVADFKGKKLFLMTFTLYYVDGYAAAEREENKCADS